MPKNSSSELISANEIANYVVCPEAWWIKHQNSSSPKQDKRRDEGKKIRKDLLEKQSSLASFKLYSKVAYVLLCLLTLLVFILENIRMRNPELIKKFFNSEILVSKVIPFEIFYLLGALGLLISFWDLFERKGSELKKSSGINTDLQPIAVK